MREENDDVIKLVSDDVISRVKLWLSIRSFNLANNN